MPLPVKVCNLSRRLDMGTTKPMPGKWSAGVTSAACRFEGSFWRRKALREVRSSARSSTLQVRAARLNKDKSKAGSGPPIDPEALATQQRLAELEAKFGQAKGDAGKPSFAAYVEEAERASAEAEAKARAAEAEVTPALSVEVGGPVKQLTDWWLGKKGGLYWLNEISYKLIFVLAGAWVVFRFLGPALGLYNLEDPLSLPLD